MRTQKPNHSVLDADQISLISRSLRNSKSFKGDPGQLSDLGERINDLLRATGLATDDDLGRHFNEDGNLEAGTNANAHHSYLSEQFRNLANLASSTKIQCSDSEVREYLSEVMMTLPLEQRDAATLTQFKAVLKAVREKIEVLLAITAEHDPSRGPSNDPYAETLAAIKAKIDTILYKINSHDLSPQLNASLLGELARVGVTSPAIPTSEDYSTPAPDVPGFTALITRIDALNRAASALDIYERSQVREGRPHDSLLDTFLLALAPIFHSAVGSTKPDAALAATSTGDYINFCSDVLQYYFPPEDLAPEALAKRWQRLRKSP